MNNPETNNKGGTGGSIPIPVIVFFALVALALFAAAGYYYYLTWATIHTVNGISVLRAPYFKARAIVITAAGIVATVADVYLVRLRLGKR